MKTEQDVKAANQAFANLHMCAEWFFAGYAAFFNGTSRKQTSELRFNTIGTPRYDLDLFTSSVGLGAIYESSVAILEALGIDPSISYKR